jgi:DNA mismatch repair protein MutL
VQIEAPTNWTYNLNAASAFQTNATQESLSLPETQRTYNAPNDRTLTATEWNTGAGLQAAEAVHSVLLGSARFVGSLFNTYILYESQSEIIMIDQHAAHERVRYEKLRQTLSGSPEQPLSAQTLLVPEVVKFPPEQKSLIGNNLEGLSRFGFDAEIFGEDSLVFRAVPAEWGTQQLKVRLKNLIERVLESCSTSIVDENLFETLASEACHSSVRAGDPLEPIEMMALVDQLLKCDHPWNCPHGRPTLVKIPERKIEEWFRRK